MEESIENYIRKQLYETSILINRQIFTKENVKFNKRDDFNEIKDRIDNYLDGSSERFFVLPGLRGVGKTTLLFQIYEYLFKQKDITSDNLLYISCDMINKFGDVDIFNIVEIYLKKFHNTDPILLDKPVFILVDEAQYDKNWALNGKLLFDQSQNIFMILTGSSSLHLSYNADAARRLKIKTILPLNYTQHLKLKYNYHTNIQRELFNLIFSGDVKKAKEKELQIEKDLINLIDYGLNDWDIYFKYGAFPSTLNKSFKEDIVSQLWSIVSKIVSNDITNEFDLNKNSQDRIYKILIFLASQKPGEITQNKIASHTSINVSTVNSLFNILEKTQLIFHYQAYGGSAKRIKKSWKYYFATPSLKNSINEEFGNTILDQKDYECVLLENLVASTLFNLSNNNNFHQFSTYYDSNNGGVDFILQKTFEHPIPIEVGIGNKKNKQIKKAINKYSSPHGIVISNRTNMIEKEDDVIYIPPKTFSFL